MELRRATQAADRGSRTEAEGAGVPCVKIRFLFMFRRGTRPIFGSLVV
jgi:hypothetical protein